MEVQKGFRLKQGKDKRGPGEGGMMGNQNNLQKPVPEQINVQSQSWELGMIAV